MVAKVRTTTDDIKINTIGPNRNSQFNWLASVDDGVLRIQHRFNADRP